MWTVVYIAQSKESADKLYGLLDNTGLLAKVKPVAGGTGAENCYEVLVPNTEVDQAHTVLIDAEL